MRVLSDKGSRLKVVTSRENTGVVHGIIVSISIFKHISRARLKMVPALLGAESLQQVISIRPSTPLNSLPSIGIVVSPE